MMNLQNKRVTTHYYRLTPRVPGGVGLFPIVWTRLLIVLHSYWSTQGVPRGWTNQNHLFYVYFTSGAVIV